MPNNDHVAQLVGILLILIDQGFFMGTFFLIAGHFTPASYDRKGAGGLLRDRVVRLLIPLFAFDLVLGPLVTIPILVADHAPVGPSLGTYLSHRAATARCGSWRWVCSPDFLPVSS